MATIDYNQQLADMQAALRALWPDRPVVYFTAQAHALAEQGPGWLLTDEEQGQLRRVAQAIGAARNSEEQIARTTREIQAKALEDAADRAQARVGINSLWLRDDAKKIRNGVL